MFTEAGQPLSVGPVGEMVQLIFTWPVNPFKGETVAVKTELLPTTTDADKGEIDTEKSVTVSVLEAGCVLVDTLALVPEAVTVSDESEAVRLAAAFTVAVTAP